MEPDLNEAQHSSGPWAAVEEGGRWTIYLPETHLLNHVAYLSDGGVPEDQEAANARLIAASPFLLAALQRLVIQMNNLLMVADVPERFAASFNDAQRQASAAIASATGVGQ